MLNQDLMDTQKVSNEILKHLGNTNNIFKLSDFLRPDGSPVNDPLTNSDQTYTTKGAPEVLVDGLYYWVNLSDATVKLPEHNHATFTMLTKAVVQSLS